ncbi:unnamed protein product [Cladocopium goreaui]|uniref:Uncharacterized protein n=1 Tax=Cladocopium goreaui TaxID=2562237 RepID=A0A9P1BH70_9DINO|nr:unnamed protein product [Cladocopium goreaui]
MDRGLLAEAFSCLKRCEDHSWPSRWEIGDTCSPPRAWGPAQGRDRKQRDEWDPRGDRQDQRTSFSQPSRWVPEDRSSDLDRAVSSPILSRNKQGMVHC